MLSTYEAFISESLWDLRTAVPPNHRPVTNCEQSKCGGRKATILHYRLLNVDASVCGPRESGMGPVRHFWQADCAALRKSDPVWLLGHIESRIAAIERRYSLWGSDPGTPAELRAIQNALSALQRLMNEALTTYVEAPQRIGIISRMSL